MRGISGRGLTILVSEKGGGGGPRARPPPPFRLRARRGGGRYVFLHLSSFAIAGPCQSDPEALGFLQDIAGLIFHRLCVRARSHMYSAARLFDIGILCLPSGLTHEYA